MSQIQVDRIINNAGTGAPTCSRGLIVSIASTVGYALTVTGDLNVTGTIPKAVAFSIALGM
jgi:tetrahydromethanopterin S-methyltransferase subunit E